MIAHKPQLGVSADQNQLPASPQFQTHSSLHSDVRAGTCKPHLLCHLILVRLC